MAHAQENTRSNPTERGLPQEFELSSPAFADGATIARRHTADGDDVSPRLTWSGIPEGTASLALICEDPDASRGTFAHWIAWNLNPERGELPEAVPATGPTADGIRQGQNDFGQTGYRGPAPPSGKPHRYIFRLYALDSRLDLPEDAKRADLSRAIEGHVLGEARVTGMYSRGEHE